MTPPSGDSTGRDRTARVRIDARAEDSAYAYVAGRDLYVVHGATPAPVSALRTLPRDVPGFTGRQAEIDQLLAASRPTGVVAIRTIDGMPGVGKTALAVHAAHRLTGHFPDGQLFVPLHAHTPGQRPVDPAEALAALLISIGVDPQHIPDSLDARAGLWRDRLAGKRILLVLDDAAGRAQVEPLVPGAGDGLVIVTSRHRIAAVDGATPLPLDTLPPSDGTRLFTRLADRTPATAADTGAVADLVRLSGYLPLAIALLAGRLAHHPDWNLGEFAADFAATRDRLGELTEEDRAVAAAFDASYRALPVGRQVLFRRLGLHPGTDVDTYSAAALANIPLARARRELEALYRDHLVDSPAVGRYRLHDLLRTYAHDLAAGDREIEREEAISRLMDYVQHTADRADAHLARNPRPVATASVISPAAAPELRDRHQAQAWMSMECANLFACIEHATTHHHHARIVSLTAAIADHLRNAGPWAQATTLHTAALTAAHHIGDSTGKGNALYRLGDVRRLSGDYPGAAAALEQALDIYRAIDSRLGQANTLCQLGIVRWLTDDYPGATAALEQALNVYRAINCWLGQANALNHLGGVQWLTGNYQNATTALERALAIYRDIGNRPGQAHALSYMGAVQIATGNFRSATAVFEEALNIYRDIGDPAGEAHALHGIGIIRLSTKDNSGATGVLKEALAIYHDIGDQNGQANALNHIGAAHIATKKYARAAVVLEHVLDTYRHIGDRAGEAEVLNRLGTLHRSCGSPRQAQALHQHALELARTIHHQLEEARALEGTARCRRLISDYPVALSRLCEAVSIYQRIGAAETPTAAAYLAQLQAEHLGESAAARGPTDS